jgi:hypothetical protein
MRAFAALAALSVASIAGLAAESAQPPRQPAGLIVGQVVDAVSGRPVSGAVVALTGDVRLPDGRPLPTSSVLTTPDGRFVFRDLPAGTFGITASKPGYHEGAFGRRRPAGSPQQLTLSEGERMVDAVILLWKPGAISGTVVDEAGEPVVNAIVVAYRRSMTMGARSLASSATSVTDDRGVYRLGALRPGDYIVGVSVRHFSLPTAQARAVTVSTAGFDARAFTLLGSSPAMLQVGNSLYAIGGGSPVPPPPANDRMFVYQTTYYSSTPSISQASVLTLSSGEERSGVDIQLLPVPAARVAGSIGGPEGPHATSVRLIPADARDASFDVEGPYTVSDSQGSFIFPAVPAGQYLLQARVGTSRGRADPEALWADVRLTVVDTDVTGLQVQLQRGFRITGRFEFDGSSERPTAERLQQVPLVIQPSTSRGSLPPPAVSVDDDGRFTSSELPAGRYLVRINSSPPGWRFKSATHEGRDVADVPLDLRGDAQVVITFNDRWSHLRGTVMASHGARDGEAVVLLFPTDAQQWPYASTNTRRFKSARATMAGEYTLSAVPEGEYFVVAVPDVDAGEWLTQSILEALARAATRVSIAEGETRTQNLRTQGIR